MYYDYNYLPQYSFGSWLKKNAGTIGTVAGAGIGMFGGPTGAALGASLGGSIGGAFSQDYQQDQQAIMQEEALQEQSKNIQLQNLRNKLGNNGLQQREFSGTNNFAEGGNLTARQPKNVGTPVYPDKNISFPYSRAIQLMNARLLGNNAYNPIQPYFLAEERNLTPTTQGFIYDRNNTVSPEEAAVRETISSKPREFFGTNETGVNRLIPTRPISSGNAAKAKQFLSDMYGRGQIKFANGGSLGMSNGTNVDKYSGQTHEGMNGGIPVDQNGSPVATTNNQAVGLVEDGEVSWTSPETKEVYIFSNRLTL